MDERGAFRPGAPTLQRVFANPQRKRCLGGGYEFGIECVLAHCACSISCFLTDTQPVEGDQPSAFSPAGVCAYVVRRKNMRPHVSSGADVNFSETYYAKVI